jgi:hypothetical protein
MVRISSVTLRRTQVLVVFLLIFAPNAHAAAQSGDFDFRFEFGSCLVERLDTSNGTFTQGVPGPSPRRIATAKMALTDAQMSAIYRAIENIRFFDYPAIFVGVRPGLVETAHISPGYKFRFEVRNAGVVHTVSWDDSSKPTTVEADRLRDFFTMVRDLIYDHPEFKRLPRPNVGCE